MNIDSSRIVLLTPDKKHACILVFAEDHRLPQLVILKNSKDYSVGDKIRLRKDLKISERFINGTIRYYVFESGDRNFRELPEFYRAQIVYISASKKHAAVSVLKEGSTESVLAFFPREEEHILKQYINISTQQRVAPVTKEDGSVFHFFKPGICNFIIAPKERSSYSPEYDWSDYDQSREDYYEELGNSVCEYCGDYHCDCQRNLDEQWGD